MNFENLRPSRIRITLAGITAMAGGIVSVAMVIWGGPMARYLPTGDGFHLAAVAGAGLAGLICASGFGRPGKRGWLIAALVAVVATLSGAIIGATLMGLVAGSLMGWTLGVIAILDAGNSLVAVLIWGLAMAAVHILARRARQRLPLNL